MLTGLKEIMLSENHFTGSWNFDQKVMEGLSLLYLSHNPDLRGTFSVDDLSSWNHLEVLDINATSMQITGLNSTNGTIPDFLEPIFRCSFWKYHHEDVSCRQYQDKPGA